MPKAHPRSQSPAPDEKSADLEAIRRCRGGDREAFAELVGRWQDRIHGAILGVGERVGNASLDQIIVNLKLIGELGDRDVTKLAPLCDKVSKALGVPIPANYPVVGRDAFRTGTGVHASAIIKALEKGDEELADRVYSGVPAGAFGRAQEIEIGPMSGASNVQYWLKHRGIVSSPELVSAILAEAKKSDRTLTDEETRAVVRRERGGA